MTRGHHWFSVATGCQAFLQMRQQKVNYCRFKYSNANCQPKTKHIINCPSSLTLRKQPLLQRCPWAHPDISRFPSVMQNHLNRKPRGREGTAQSLPACSHRYSTWETRGYSGWKEGKRMERKEQHNPQLQGHCSAWVTHGQDLQSRNQAAAEARLRNMKGLL